MRRILAVVAGSLIFIAVLLPHSPAQAQAACDRACLTTLLNQYLNAVVKHDPAAAPLFAGFRQTENAVVVLPGAGLWKSATALGKVQRRYFDPVTGQAAYFGIIEEGATTAVANLRLRVENRRITEAEWIVARQGEWGPGGPNTNVFNSESLIANPPPERTVPSASRASRAMLLAIANSYFDGLSTHDGNIIMHHPGCSRIENGTVMTGRARGGAPPGDCSTGLETINISLVAGRRYPIVDEEAQAVLALATFMRKPGTATRRNMFAEWFFVDDNKIRTVYAAMFFPPPDQPVPNWPPYDGNWPLPAELAAPAAPPAPRAK
jgi:hypothetical protein